MKAKAQGAHNLLVKETEKYREEKAELEAKLAEDEAYLSEATPEGHLAVNRDIEQLKRKLAKLEANYKKKAEYYSNYINYSR